MKVYYSLYSSRNVNPIFAQKMTKTGTLYPWTLAMNYDRFYIANDNTADIAYEPSIGWSAVDG